MNDDQKALVTNYDVLQKAEAAYKLLPQTGTTGTPNVIAAMAVLMGLTGVALVRKSKVKYEETE